jgi:glutamyl-tRNA synthetase
MKIRTRFAPSPTGFMHIGNLRTAIFEYLVAKHEGGDFILRREDTDQSRKVDGAIEFIYNTLKLCNMDIDEGPNNAGDCGPYIQSERLDLYKKYALELVNMGKAYPCFCTESELAEMREYADKHKIPFMYDGRCSHLSKEEIDKKISEGIPYVIRQKMPKYGTSIVKDVVYGNVKVDNNVLEDQILLKSDGYPTYNFANVIDDHLMNISHVNRGFEYLSSTPKYLLLYKAFGWESPLYIHAPWVIKADGTKISKRNKDDNLMDLINRGFLPEAIVNYLAFLGWSPKDNREFFTLKELEENFDIKRISRSSGCYDVKKLEWYNAHYIKEMDDDEYLAWVKKYLTLDISSKSDEWVNKLLLTYRSHISKGEDINEEVKNFFTDEYNLSDECKEFLASDEIIPKVIEMFANELESITDWNCENINIAIENVKNGLNVKGKLLYMPLRIKASGYMHGPELDACIYLLGKEKAINNLRK